MQLLLDILNDHVISRIEIEDLRNEFLFFREKNSESNINNIDDYVRVVKLENAGILCNDQDMALLYTYIYGLMRCYAIFKVINDFDELKSIIAFLEETLIVDFGCGPATVALAFAYYYTRLPDSEGFVDIHYLGKDISPEMIYLAESILNSDIFNNENKCVYLNDVYVDRDTGEEYYVDPTEIYVSNYIDPNNILFVFSYIFSQRSIINEVENFIKEIEIVIDSYLSATEYYILYLNSDYQQDGSAYDVFINKLEEAGFTLEIKYFRGKPWMERDHYSSKAIREFDIEQIVNLNSGPLYYQFYRIRKV